MNKIVCMFCEKGPADGVTVFRMNKKGVEGVWACAAHIKQTDAYADPEVKEITKILEKKDAS